MNKNFKVQGAGSCTVVIARLSQGSAEINQLTQIQSALDNRIDIKTINEDLESLPVGIVVKVWVESGKIHSKKVQ